MEDYTLSLNEDEEGNYGMAFTKYVDGWKTLDRFYIEINPRTGMVETYREYMLGRIPSDLNTSFDKELIEQAVIERTEELFAEIEVFVDIEFVEFDYTLTTIGPEEYAILCDVELYCYYDDAASSHQAVKFIVTETTS